MDRKPIRAALYLLSGLAIGLGIGLQVRSRAPDHPDPQPTPNTSTVTSSTTPDPSAGPREPRPEPEPISTPESTRPPAPRPSEAALAALAINNHELRDLARALAKPGSYRRVDAVLSDLVAYESALARRRVLIRDLGPETAIEPAPPLPPGLRGRIRRLARARALVLDVVEVPRQLTYIPARVSSAGAATAGVLLDTAGSNRRVTFRTRERSGQERLVVITEDPQVGRDRMRVSTVVDGRVVVARTCLLGQAGSSFARMLTLLFSQGHISHPSLTSLVDQPLGRVPSSGWIDWLRRHLELPPNPDLAEEAGPPPPLLAKNPLLLQSTGSQARLLDRPDLVLEVAREEPPLPPPARGPFFLLARNGLAVYDGHWSWMVFDQDERRVVQHVQLPAGAQQRLQWEFFPHTPSDPTRATKRFAALKAQASTRTRQVFNYLALQREIPVLERELKGKVGRMYTRDGLDALRLRDDILRRYGKLQALSHLLLDPKGIQATDRAVTRAKRDTTVAIVQFLETIIDSGRSGPVEYLLREERVKELLFQAPQAHRLRLVRKFRDRFRPWNTRVKLSFQGHTPQWYEDVQWFQED